MKETVLEGIRKIEKAATQGYGVQPIPSVLDEKLNDIVLNFQSLNKAERAAVSLAIVEHWQSSTLLCYSERMATLSVRRGSSDDLWRGLVSVVIEDCRFDAREDLIALALLHHSAIKIGVAAESLILRAASLATENTSKVIEGFLKMPPEGKAIENMGFRESTHAGEFQYQYMQGA